MEVAITNRLSNIKESIEKNLLMPFALIYLIGSLLSSIFWPFESVFFFQKIIFVFSVFFVGFILLDSSSLIRSVFALTCLIFFSYYIIELVDNQSFVYIHLMHLLRWIKYGVLFVLAYYFSQKLNNKTLNIIVKSSFLLIAFINILQLLNIAGSGATIQYFFSPKTAAIISNYSEPGVFRLTGTMMSPNDNGILMAIFALIFFFHRKVKDYYFAILALSLVFLTQSRTSTLISVGVIVLWGLLHVLKVKIISKKQIWLFLLVVGILFTISISLSYLNDIFSGSAFIGNSMNIRMENFEGVVEKSWGVILLGKGVVLNELEVFGHYLDSEITVVIAEFGIIGLTIWFAFFGLMFLLLRKYLLINYRLWVSLLLLFLGVSITNYSLFHQQMAPVLFVCLGLAIQGHKKLNQNPEKQANN